MTKVIKIVDFLAERIDNSPKGEIIIHEGFRGSILEELLLLRIERLEKGFAMEEEGNKISPENELSFLKNLLKRLMK